MQIKYRGRENFFKKNKSRKVNDEFYCDIIGINY